MRDFDGKPRCDMNAAAVYHPGVRLTLGPGRGHRRRRISPVNHAVSDFFFHCDREIISMIYTLWINCIT